MSRLTSSRSRIVLTQLLGLAVLATALYGAGFWDTKDFKQWTPKEVQKMYLDSPWAKRINIPMGSPVSAGGGGGGRGAGGGGGGGRGGGGGNQAVQMVPTLALQVRFAQAAPIKCAKVKFNMGESAELTPEMQKFLDAQEPYYIVEVEGLPAIFARFEDEPEKLAMTARLRRKKKDDIYPAKVEVRADQRATLTYFFSQADPIMLEDKEVEFFMRFEREMMAGMRPQRQGAGGQGRQGGQRQQGEGVGRGGQQARSGGRAGAMAAAMFGKDIKRKFRLKDMVYNGELAL